MAVVETRKLNKVFKRGNVGAVVNVDLESREGEFLVLLGPSGSGKTTLLRMIAGLEEPTRGDVLIGGRVVTPLPPRDRRIAMVFQSYALYPHLSVYRNIAFPLRAQGVPKEQREPQVKWAAGLRRPGGPLRRPLPGLAADEPDRARRRAGRLPPRAPAARGPRRGSDGADRRPRDRGRIPRQRASPLHADPGRPLRRAAAGRQAALDLPR